MNNSIHDTGPLETSEDMAIPFDSGSAPVPSSAAGQKSMQELMEAAREVVMLVDSVIYLPLAYDDEDTLTDQLEEALEFVFEHPDMEIFPRRFGRLPTSDEDAFNADMVCWFEGMNITGYLVKVRRPVMRYTLYEEDGRYSSSFSWGRYAYTWRYGDSLEEAMTRAIAWATEKDEADKKLAKVVKS